MINGIIEIWFIFNSIVYKIGQKKHQFFSKFTYKPSNISKSANRHIPKAILFEKYRIRPFRIIQETHVPVSTFLFFMQNKNI